jgi:hypothetical protein
LATTPFSGELRIGIAGVAPIERSHVQIDATVRAGYIIDLSPRKPIDAPIDVTPKASSEDKPKP